ncbi:MAG: BREX-1 system adenine-specific DNA-methyltransferase PglX, partial [Actinomycetota bacterium]|nr:BREX-1 system adenine-specific DNA-methyltransferase PglX [Actinomycetota bacterium]
YEQWHRLLFARFLAENNLLLHPKFETAVTLDDCDELAAELGEPDAWSVAARFAAEILPGIFRLDDPCVRLRFAPEGRHALERIIDALPREVFLADDALGWVYQFWQKDKKDEVNKSERKIGGADLGPVTQLFTENYMVRFLLENSLGAWWAARHPDSPLVKGFEYLRFDDDGTPVAGTFDGWPERVAEVTVMDPCCGSGHFLVEAFSMLWQMRAEEEGLSPVEAQDVVLRDNLFGLELDPRCVQIAMFAVALTAWRTGGWRAIARLNIVTSGLSINAPMEEWVELAGSDARLERALARLHRLFRNGETLGSLIDPRDIINGGNDLQQGSLEDVEWEEVAPLLHEALAYERADSSMRLLGVDAVSAAQAADMLTRRYTLVATNVPYLSSVNQGPALKRHLSTNFREAKADLGTAFMRRCVGLVRAGGSLALVTPQNWLYLGAYEEFRKWILRSTTLGAVARLGPGAFSAVTGEVVKPLLLVADNARPAVGSRSAAINTETRTFPIDKATALAYSDLVYIDQQRQLKNPDARIILDTDTVNLQLLKRHANSHWGLGSGDDVRYVRHFWELTRIGDGWIRHQGAVAITAFYGGREHVIRWDDGRGDLADEPGAHIRGTSIWGSRGVVVSQTGDLAATLYTGDAWNQNCATVIPRDDSDLAAVWAYCSSDEFRAEVRKLDQSLKVTNATLLKVPFDIEHWRKIAAEAGPLPEPWSDDPTQWLFEGRPEVATAPLQVAVGRLLGYRWPEQPKSDDLDRFADADGIVCLPPVAREAPAADRLQDVLATAFGSAWSPGKVKQLLEQTGTRKNLDGWLRDEFFKQHCALFGNRPFVWHVWDGRKDGFSALVNYHKLDRNKLEKLVYTY